VVLVCVLVVAAVLIGGLTQIGPQSKAFDTSVNRSFVSQAALLAQESNVTAASLRRLMASMPQQDRPTLEVALSDIAAQATGQATRAAALVTQGGLQAQLAAVFADREKAAQEVHSAVDGLLGLHPLAVAGAPDGAGSGAGVPTLLSATQATDRIAAAGRLLAASDRSYQQVRHAFVRLAGHPRLPASKWITAADSWQIGSVATQVDLVAASTTLVATHQLVLSAVGITPPALPSPTGVATPGVSVLSPTTKVTVSVVLTNAGSVDEPHASVTFTLAPAPGSTGAVATTTRTTLVASNRSVTLSPVSFRVKPGSSYQLTVAIGVPAGQTDVANTSLGQLLQIAPST
jgi:hypothetical protein